MLVRQDNLLIKNKLSALGFLSRNTTERNWLLVWYGTCGCTKIHEITFVCQIYILVIYQRWKNFISAGRSWHFSWTRSWNDTASEMHCGLRHERLFYARPFLKAWTLPQRGVTHVAKWRLIFRWMKVIDLSSCISAEVKLFAIAKINSWKSLAPITKLSLQLFLFFHEY